MERKGLRRREGSWKDRLYEKKGGWSEEGEWKGTDLLLKHVFCVLIPRPSRDLGLSLSHAGLLARELLVIGRLFLHQPLDGLRRYVEGSWRGHFFLSWEVKWGVVCGRFSSQMSSLMQWRQMREMSVTCFNGFAPK